MESPDDRESLVRLSEAIAQAIARKDAAALRLHLAPGFVQRSAGGEASDLEGFLRGVSTIPYPIEFVRLESLDIDLTPCGALATGIQHARVLVDGKPLDDRRRFVDWFVRIDGTWKIQAAVDAPWGGEPEPPVAV